ncbi:MAG TPA: L-2-hydroxyglutarate oxidase [Planctomycetaceae bacterium]|nr:L-2-hydroxyglutarate oxidase [Planctomycetaceae bacterium]
MIQTDVAIIGGGIVGLATAYRLLERFPGTKVTILEKEASLAFHQSGRNSGVLHSGIYYKPGSLRATNCREGKKAMVEFCQREGVAFDICGKVIVAVTESELPNLQTIFERGQANGVQCAMIGPERLRELEPHSAGIQAIHVPEAGIVDYPAVCEKLAHRIREKEGSILLNARVTGMRRSNGRMILQSSAGDIEARCVVTCAGLHCDRVAKLSGTKPDAKIVPFRGEYYELKPDARHLCRNLIYPVPDPKFPFLGVHFTRLIHGGIECGPNAVLAFAREGYTKLDINPLDLIESLTYPGFLRMAAKHWRIGCGEMWRSFSKAAFVRALQRLMPDIRAEHIHSAPSGVRAQALGRDGKLVDDFVIVENDLVVNVLNAPSPAATAALNVGRLIVDKLAGRLS